MCASAPVPVLFAAEGPLPCPRGAFYSRPAQPRFTMSQAFSRLAPVLALACLMLLPVAARAADPTYTVSGIHVDATAPSASAAEAIAIDQGRPTAWNILFKRIAKQSDWSKQ